MSQVKEMLESAKRIQKNADEVTRLKGEQFNIFSVLRRESDEVVVHNRFIAEMLSPDGAHGLGDTPLRCFVNYIQSLPRFTELKGKKEDKEYQKELRDKLSGDFYVKAEHNLGKISEDKTTGGFVDIAMLSKDLNVFIESKIYAHDQPNQLLRYSNGNDNTPNLVCYLTLNGRESPSSEQKLEVNKDYLRLSYETDIINWLTEVNKHAYDFPILRETIKQYINLVKKLTGQLYNQQMQNELLDLIGSSAENYKAAKLIYDNFEKVGKQAYADFFERLSEKLEPKKIDRSKDNREDAGFATLFSRTIEGSDYSVGIQVELGNRHLFICAIEKLQSRKPINKEARFNGLAEELKEAFESRGFSAKRHSWFLYGPFPIEFNLQEYLLSDEEKRKEIVEKVAGVYEEVKACAVTIKELNHSE